MTTTNRAQSRNVLGQAIRTGAGLALMAIVATGCMGQSKDNKAHATAAKIKMEGLKAASEFKMGEQAFLAGDLHKALKHTEISMSLNDKVAKTYVLFGRIKMEMGDVEGASDALAQAQKIDAKSVDAEYYEGILAERIDRRDEALGHYQAACELDGSNPQYAIAAAEMMIEAGEIEKAETFLLGRRNTFDHNAGIRQTIGHIEMMKGDTRQAAAIYSEAHLLAPDDQSITEDLIRAQIATEKYAEAEYNLSRLLTGKENKNRRDLLQMRAACQVRLDRPVEARQILMALTSGQEGAADVDAWINLGEISYQLHDINHLKQAANRVTAIAPERPEGYILRALLLRKTGDLEGARASAQTAISLKQSADSFVLLGMIDQDLSHNEDARKSYAAALRENPKDPNAGRLLNALDQIAAVE